MESFAVSGITVFTLLFGTGIGMAFLSSYLQCSKGNIVESVKEGTIFSAILTLLYCLLSYFPVLRNPFKNTLENYFHISPESSTVIAVGYVMMILSWPLAVRMIYSTEKNICKPDVDEMNEFKKKLMAELEEKQKEEKDNVDKK